MNIISGLLPESFKGHMKKGVGQLRAQIDKRPLIWSISMVAFSILFVSLMVALPSALLFLIGPAIIFGVAGIAIGLTYLMNKNKKFAQILTKIHAIVLPILYIGAVAACLAFAPHSFIFLVIGVVGVCGVIPILMYSINQLRRREASSQNSRMAKNRARQRQVRNQNAQQQRRADGLQSTEGSSSPRRAERRRAGERAVRSIGRGPKPHQIRRTHSRSPSQSSLRSS